MNLHSPRVYIHTRVSRKNKSRHALVIVRLSVHAQRIYVAGSIIRRNECAGSAALYEVAVSKCLDFVAARACNKSWEGIGNRAGV